MYPSLPHPREILKFEPADEYYYPSSIRKNSSDNFYVNFSDSEDGESEKVPDYDARPNVLYNNPTKYKVSEIINENIEESYHDEKAKLGFKENFDESFHDNHEHAYDIDNRYENPKTNEYYQYSDKNDFDIKNNPNVEENSKNEEINDFDLRNNDFGFQVNDLIDNDYALKGLRGEIKDAAEIFLEEIRKKIVKENRRRDFRDIYDIIKSARYKAIEKLQEFCEKRISEREFHVSAGELREFMDEKENLILHTNEQMGLEQCEFQLNDFFQNLLRNIEDGIYEQDFGMMIEDMIRYHFILNFAFIILKFLSGLKDFDVQIDTFDKCQVIIEKIKKLIEIKIPDFIQKHQ